MTHLEPIIRDVKKFIPKPKHNKVVKARVLAKLYQAEAKEKKQHKPKHHTMRRRKQSITSSALSGLSSYLKARSERKRQQRIQKAETIRKIRESNLSQSLKQREQVKAGVPIYKEDNDDAM